jgi:cytochrome c biogenesis protein CcmG/thiol:disulfide interchange protein DsbE
MAARAAATRRTRYGLGALAVAAVVAVAALTATGGGTGGAVSPERFSLPRLGGRGRVELAAYRGKPVVVNMFASWCDQCRFELPGYARVASELRGKVTFIGVNSQETGDGLGMAREFHLGESGFLLAKDVGASPASGLHDAYGAEGMPVSAFYDASGKLVDRELQSLPEPVPRQKLDQLFGLRV